MATSDADDSLRIIAPFGLDDLFGMMVRRNPARASAEIYRRRVADKRYPERWPRVTVIHE
ncbi:nucleotidyltransferase family protein [Chromobacterium vaccinii]|uniref:nucleotidyltransferase family protein n=1 Tax=Chromobacterium vaccinii TaxID=1108595 RepID=UPI003260B576